MQDPRISEIFYYFETHTDIVNGRTVGRKIGVVQEIIIKKFLLTDEKIRDCLIYEPRLRGRSGATHKVEFVLFAPIAVAEIVTGHSFRIREPSLEVSVQKVDHVAKKARISVLTGEGTKAKRLGVEQAFQVTVVWLGQPKILFVKLVDVGIEKCRVSILESTTPLASLESKRVGAQPDLVRRRALTPWSQRCAPAGRPRTRRPTAQIEHSTLRFARPCASRAAHLRPQPERAHAAAHRRERPRPSEPRAGRLTFFRA